MVWHPIDSPQPSTGRMIRTPFGVAPLAFALIIGCARDNEAPVPPASASPPAPATTQPDAEPRHNAAMGSGVPRPDSAAPRVGAVPPDAPSPPRQATPRAQTSPRAPRDSARGTVAITASCPAPC